MKIISLRPYKKWGDTQLLNKLFKIYDDLRNNKGDYDENKDLCNIMIQEAKQRNLTCPKELMYQNIIHQGKMN